MHLSGLNQTGRLTRGGQTSMGRGQGVERPQRKGFWDPRRLQYLLNVLKADLLGTMRNAFYHQKINFKKKNNALLLSNQSSSQCASGCLL